MPFKFHPTDLDGVILVEQRVFKDARGFFMESFKESDFREAGIPYSFVQDNHSFSLTGVIRGLHFQKAPMQQGKLVSVITGEIFDVAVDLRKESKNFGRWYGTILSEENTTMLWIPPGFAHGFQALKNSHVHYKTTAEFSQSLDGGIRWNDPEIGIDWPNGECLVSEKDAQLPFLRDSTVKRRDSH